jgi:hypothetical protein
VYEQEKRKKEVTKMQKQRKIISFIHNAILSFNITHIKKYYNFILSQNEKNASFAVTDLSLNSSRICIKLTPLPFHCIIIFILFFELKKDNF